MVKTKYTGVYYRDTKSGDRVFYLVGKLHGKTYSEKVGSKSEGVTAAYASQVRGEKHSLSRMGEKSPKYKAPKLTLNEGFDKYMEEIVGKSDTRNTKGRYDNHIREHLGRMNMEEITSDDIKGLAAKKRGEISFKTGRKYSPKTINDIINLVSVIFNHNKINNPAKAVKRDNTDNSRERYLNEQEITLLLKTIDTKKGLRKREIAKLFTVLALTTGARATSVLTIKQSDIMGDRIKIRDHKTNSTYYAALHDSVKPLLPKGLEPTDYIVGGNAKPMHRMNLSKMLQPILNELFNGKLEVEDAQNRVVIHTFRHTFGSLLAINKTPIYTIKKLMNHTKIEMTMRYAKLSPDIGFDAVNALNIGGSS